MSKDFKRPDPELLLKQVQNNKEQSGKLKIFIGMAAGVGKTFAMLSDALSAKKQGKDIVIGYVEHHGRYDTEILTEEFEKIPLLKINHNGLVLTEFNLDEAIKRKPDIILVDELAHSNIDGLQHHKRWQDILDLKAEGIEVWTTVNIQHIESLSEVITSITGVTVRETVPDKVLLESDSIELVDLQPEELIKRIKEGKVYKKDKLDTALNGFFSISNLTALRELVLRKVADRVDRDTLKYRALEATGNIWQTSERILVAIGPTPFAKQLIRAAHRISERRHGTLIVISVQTVNQGNFSDEQKFLLQDAIKLAEQLGAEVVQRIADSIPDEILKFANLRNVTLIVAGKPARKKFYDIFNQTIVDKLIDKSGSIDLHLIKVSAKKSVAYRYVKSKIVKPFVLFLPVIIVSIITIICFSLHGYLGDANLIMLYLLGVVYVSVRSSKTEATLTSILSVLAFDFFFVPPYLTFSVHDFEYILTFLIMLFLALTITSMTATIKNQNKAISEREQITNLLYGLVRKLIACNESEKVCKILQETISQSLNYDACIFIEKNNIFQIAIASQNKFENEQREFSIAHWSFINSKIAGNGTENLPSSKAYYIPIKSENKNFGVIGIDFSENIDQSIKNTIEVIAQQGAQALKRIYLEQESKNIELKSQIERDRNSLLSSISHDLRTPLTSINGAASVLLEDNNLDENISKELKQSVYDQSLRLSELVKKVLDLTKLENENLKLDLEWYPIEEIISSALEDTAECLGNRKVYFSPKEPTLAYVDGVILQQVFVNIFENAAKYTTETSEISIKIQTEDERLRIVISDNGGGLEPGQEEVIFSKAFRGSTTSTGFGLGLPICKAIINLHHGKIYAKNRLNEGLDFVIELPLQEQPVINYE